MEETLSAATSATVLRTVPFNLGYILWGKYEGWCTKICPKHNKHRIKRESTKCAQACKTKMKYYKDDSTVWHPYSTRARGGEGRVIVWQEIVVCRRVSNQYWICWAPANACFHLKPIGFEVFYTEEFCHFQYYCMSQTSGIGLNLCHLVIMADLAIAVNCTQRLSRLLLVFIHFWLYWHHYTHCWSHWLCRTDGKRVCCRYDLIWLRTATLRLSQGDSGHEDAMWHVASA